MKQLRRFPLRMRLALPLLLILALAAPMAVASPLPPACTPSYYPFINPGIDRSCLDASVGLDGVCVGFGHVATCLP